MAGKYYFRERALDLARRLFGVDQEHELLKYFIKDQYGYLQRSIDHPDPEMINRFYSGPENRERMPSDLVLASTYLGLCFSIAEELEKNGVL